MYFKFPQKLIRDTPEHKFWKGYETTYQKTESSAIQCIRANNKKNLIAYCFGFNLVLFSGRKNIVRTTIDKLFKDPLTSLDFRDDGRLIATAEASGVVKVIDVQRKTQLRKHTKHNKAVHAITFQNQSSHICTGSDDLLHQDYIRGICALPSTSNKLLTSSYDGTARLIDTDDIKNSENYIFNHGIAIESIDVFPNGNTFVTVGGNLTKIWDIRNYNEPIANLSNNQKTVTSVRVLESGDRFLTGSLDQQLKIFDVKTFDVVHQFELPEGVLTFDVTPKLTHLAIGLTDGQISIQFRKTQLESATKSGQILIEEDKPDNFDNELEFLRKGQDSYVLKNYKYFNRGIYDEPETYDIKFEEQKKRDMKDYDKFLKKFQYRDALTAAIQSKQTGIVIAMIEELVQRSALEIALTNRDNEELRVLFEFIIDKINNPRYSQILLELSSILINIYAKYINDREIIRQFCETLKDHLNEEYDLQKDLIRTKGQIETLVALQQNLF